MKHTLTIGVSLSLFATLLYSIMSAMIKAYGQVLPPLPVFIFFQNLLSLLFILPFIFRGNSEHIKRTLKTTRLKLHLLRACTSLTIMFTLYYAVGKIPLVNAMLLSNCAPLIVPFVGYLFFAEKINHRMWFPVLIGYAGVAIILNPDSNFFQPAAIIAFTSAIALAVTIQIVRKLTMTDSTTTITFYFTFLTTIISFIIAIPFWQAVNLDQFAIIVLISALYFTSQYIANASMRFGNPQLISALMYSNVVYAAIISVLVWNDVPTSYMLLGMLLVVIGGASCIWVEHITLSKIERIHV